MIQQLQGVLIAIDWENIRRGAQLYHRNVKPAELCRAMSGVIGGGKLDHMVGSIVDSLSGTFCRRP